MPKIILVRHAQASLGKSDYDALSDLGHKQAAILGRYIEQASWRPECIITGSLNRHKQTASGIQNALSQSIPTIENPDWNEFDFKRLIQSYLEQHPEELPEKNDVRAFFSILKKAMLAWSCNELSPKSGPMESWNTFSDRINNAIKETQRLSGDNPIIVVSSGGAIAMLLKQILEINAKTMIDINFQIRNTSFTEVMAKPHKINLVAFNQVNHLSFQEDQHLLTFA